MIEVPKAQILLLISAYGASRVDFLVDATSVKMDYLPIGHARVDPILRDDCLSDHVHTFYGPQSGVDPRRIDTSDNLELHSLLLDTDIEENTGNVEENKSLYWHPTVYKYDRSSDTYTRDAMAGSSAYYIWETGETTAFPNGFRMIGGFDTEKSQANAECVNESPCDEGDCYTENDFFPATKCEELEVSMAMPNCWDGVSIDSPPDHTSHVAYTEDGEFDGECPPTHPIRVPQIRLFFRIMPYDGGWHTFSDGSGVYHSDYVSGWDEEFLQGVLDECDNDGFAAMPNFFCEDFLTFRDAPKCTDEDTCDFADPALIEKVRAFQPLPLDVMGTIVAEETEVLVGELPRGTCDGSLVEVGEISTEEILSEEDPSEEMASEDMASEEILSEEDPSDEMASEDMASEEILSEEDPSEEMTSEDMASEEMLSEEDPSEEMTSEDMASEEILSEEDPSEEIASAEMPSSGCGDDAVYGNSGWNGELTKA